MPKLPRLRPFIAGTAFIVLGIVGFRLMGASWTYVGVTAIAGAIIIPLQIWYFKKLWEDDWE